MKYIEDSHIPIIELTRRNLKVLLAKLDDPLSSRMLVTGKGRDDHAAVRAVEDDEHYSDREPGEMLVGGVVV